MRLMNTVVVVTGGASGMGEAICRKFAKEGAKVVIADYNYEGALKVANEINAETLDAAAAIKTDISIEADADAMIDTAIALFGKVDILVNNAGIMDGFEPVWEVSNERWDRIFAVNVNGSMYASRKAIQYFLEQGSGNIINIASIGGLQGGRAGAAYVASKHAVIGLTKNTAFMYAKKGIRRLEFRQRRRRDRGRRLDQLLIYAYCYRKTNAAASFRNSRIRVFVYS